MCNTDENTEKFLWARIINQSVKNYTMIDKFPDPKVGSKAITSRN